MLKKEEELALARDWKDNRSPRARERLLLAYQPMIRSMAGKHMRAGLDKDDLIQEGNIGFLSGLDNFDPSLGHSVGTLARFHVAARMQIFISEFNGVLRLPRSRRIKGLLTKCVSSIRLAEANAGRELGDAEKEAICKEFGFDLAELQEYERVIRPAKSLSGQATDEEGVPFELVDPDSLDNPAMRSQSLAEMAGILVDVLEKMPERTRRILILRHMNEEFVSLEDIAKEFNLSRERVRRIEIDGLILMREHLESMGIKGFHEAL